MQLRLPDQLPSAGVRAELRFRRMPREPCVLRVRSPQGVTIARFDLYGRGEGSTAAQRVVLNVRVGADSIAEHGLGPGDALELVAESLEGKPLDPASLDLELIAATWSS